MLAEAAAELPRNMPAAALVVSSAVVEDESSEDHEEDEGAALAALRRSAEADGGYLETAADFEETLRQIAFFDESGWEYDGDDV